MSDAPTFDERGELVAIANEYRRLQRQLEAKQAQLASLMEINGEAGDFPTDFDGAVNRRYSIDFTFPPGVGFFSDPLPEAQERSVQIEKGTIFRCAYIESFVRAIGTGEDTFVAPPTEPAVQATVPWDLRVLFFDYFWNVRDTGTDREWCSSPQPALFGGGGYTGPLWLPRRQVLGGGTVIYASVAPFLARDVDTIPVFFQNGIQSYTVQMSFVGHSVTDRSAT
jgi:hypothetical protein